MPNTRRGFAVPTSRSRPIVAVATFLAAALALFLAGCSSSDDSADREVIDKLRIGVIGPSAVLSGPVGFAHSRGELLASLKPLGVNAVEIVNFPNGPDLNQALVGGRLDVATYGDTPALVAKGSGLATRPIAFAQFNLNAGVVVRDSSPVKSLRDLAGKKIGVPKGSYIDRYLRGALAAEGLSATFVHLYPADQEAPLSSGEIDAAALPNVVPSVNLGTFLAKGFRLVDSVYGNHPNLAGTSVTVSSDTFLAKHPDFAATWQRLQADAVRYAKAHWNEFVAFEIAHSKAKPEIVRAAANPASYSEEAFPAAAVTLLTGTKKFLVEQGSIKTDFDVDGWFYRTAPAADGAQAEGTAPR
ncbi:ABC transporter substrate-binding protein [Gordonia sp. ABSL1-1]|uniref:ABC transporter substrate-binding protein n=1 Tax=Gordonia sp. ABSL1-1 TaxID=3053923 RepID=UPI002573CB7F|nr:ABC transporter substrate-binding protein [Gordonia sp. ABSL1-1]MDL9936865.1 ABC transporter substrate-binding protein [Gordonia sp. ABSL1-1]